MAPSRAAYTHYTHLKGCDRDHVELDVGYDKLVRAGNRYKEFTFRVSFLLLYFYFVARCDLFEQFVEPWESSTSNYNYNL